MRTRKVKILSHIVSKGYSIFSFKNFIPWHQRFSTRKSIFLIKGVRTRFTIFRKRFYVVSDNLVHTGPYVLDFQLASSRRVWIRGKNRPKIRFDYRVLICWRDTFKNVRLLSGCVCTMMSTSIALLVFIREPYSSSILCFWQ